MNSHLSRLLAFFYNANKKKKHVEDSHNGKVDIVFIGKAKSKEKKKIGVSNYDKNEQSGNGNILGNRKTHIV